MNRSLVKTLVLSSLSLTHGLAFAVVYDIVGPGMDFGTAVATNASGETFIAGHFQGSVDFSATVSLTGTGATDGYLAMVDRNIVWAVAVGGNGGAAVNINDVAALSDGSVVVVGQFTDNLIAGGLVATGALDAFVARFDSVGNAIWATQIGGSGGESAWGVAVDSADNIFVTGNFYESVLGTTIESANMGANAVINSSGSYDGFLAAYNADGQLLWYDTMGGVGFDYGWHVAVDSLGDLYVTGSFQDIATVAGTALTSAGGYDIFVAQYDNSGVSQWVVQAGGASTDEGRGVNVTASGDVLVTGYFSGTADFDALAVSSSGVSDNEMFLARYDSGGNIQWVSSYGGTDRDRGFRVAEDLAGTAWVVGYTDVGFGDIVVGFDSVGNFVNSKSLGVFATGNAIAVNPLNGKVRLTGYKSGPDAFVASF